MEHANADLARRFLQALDGQDFGTIATLVAEDVVAGCRSGIERRAQSSMAA